jgi:hypothetical protein
MRIASFLHRRAGGTEPLGHRPAAETATPWWHHIHQGVAHFLACYRQNIRLSRGKAEGAVSAAAYFTA